MSSRSLRIEQVRTALDVYRTVHPRDRRSIREHALRLLYPDARRLPAFDDAITDPDHPALVEAVRVAYWQRACTDYVSTWLDYNGDVPARRLAVCLLVGWRSPSPAAAAEIREVRQTLNSVAWDAHRIVARATADAVLRVTWTRRHDVYAGLAMPLRVLFPDLLRFDARDAERRWGAATEEMSRLMSAYELR